MLSGPVLPLSPIQHLYNPVIPWNAAAPLTSWWRWEHKNGKHGCGRRQQTLLGELANAVLGRDVKVKCLVILNDFLLDQELRESKTEWSALCPEQCWTWFINAAVEQALCNRDQNRLRSNTLTGPEKPLNIYIIVRNFKKGNCVKMCLKMYKITLKRKL